LLVGQAVERARHDAYNIEGAEHRYVSHVREDDRQIGVGPA
jgi:hypothetical protein